MNSNNNISIACREQRIFNQGNKRGILVLGMHRSGSSVLSRALVAAGVYLGDDLLTPQPDNPKGYFEDRIANQLNEILLNEMRCRWYTLLLPLDIATQAVMSYQKNVKDRVFDRFDDKLLWGLKDPRLSRFWRLWLPIFAETAVEPVFLLAHRHPFSVASSLAKRDGMPGAHALALWALHQLDALEALVENGGLVVNYDLMMASPQQELFRIANFLGIADQLDPIAIGSFANDFLSHDLRHSQLRNPSASSPLQALCLELYTGIFAFAQLAGGLGDQHIDQARNLVAKCRSELAASVGWMQAIDALPFGVADEAVAAQSLLQGLSGDLKNVATLLNSSLAQRDQIIADQSKQLRSLRDELLRAEAQLNLLKDVMLSSRALDFL